MSTTASTFTSAPAPVRDAPAFDFYPERWLVGVAALSDAEQIAYLRLLCHQWLLGDAGLPAEAPALKRLAGKGVTAALLAKFPVQGNGARKNARLECVREEQRARILSRRTGAALTNARRYGVESVGTEEKALLEAAGWLVKGRLLSTEEHGKVLAQRRGQQGQGQGQGRAKGAGAGGGRGKGGAAAAGCETAGEGGGEVAEGIASEGGSGVAEGVASEGCSGVAEGVAGGSPPPTTHRPPPTDLSKASVPPGGGGIARPTLAQARELALQIGITPADAESWWTAREASGWLRTSNGAAMPVGANWQADAKTYTNNALERRRRAPAPRNDAANRPGRYA